MPSLRGGFRIQQLRLSQDNMEEVEEEDCQMDTHQRRLLQQLNFDGQRGIRQAAT